MCPGRHHVSTKNISKLCGDIPDNCNSTYRPGPIACVQACSSRTGSGTEGVKPHHWPSDDTYLAPAVLLAKSGVMMTPASAPAQAPILIGWLAWVKRSGAAALEWRIGLGSTLLQLTQRSGLLGQRSS